MPKVSVIVPVYNVEKYLKECLDSIQNQTLKDIEIICINDGSTDLSTQILDEYVQNDSRFKVIHKTNEGYGKAMNVGMDLAEADYIGIVESDDKIESDMYEKLYAIMEEKHVDMIKADYYEFCEGINGEDIENYISAISESKLKGISFTKELAEEYLTLYDKEFNIKEYEGAFLFEKYTWSGLYSKAFLQKNHIRHNETPGASYQDNGFWFQTMVKAERIYFTKQAFYHYRIDNLNSSIHSKAKVFSVCDEFEFIYDILCQMGEEGDRFKKWATLFKIIDSLGNLTRVADEYKEMLAARIKEELLLALDRKDYNMDLYAVDWKSRLFDVLISPQNYIEKEIKRIQKIDNIIQDYNMIIVYGAGILGRSMYGILGEGRRNIKVKYFAVSEMSGNPEKLFGVPVKQIEELLEYREKALVIISVGKKYVQDVEMVLKKLNFSHYAFINDF